MPEKRDTPFDIEWSSSARVEFKGLRAFDRRPVRRAIDELRWQALVETTNRKPLREALDAAVEASWEIRVNRLRVLYRVDGETVSILRVILKDGETAESL